MHSKQNDEEKNEQLSYNAYGELTRVTDTDSNQTTQYQYDLNANRLGFSSPKAKADYEYKAGTDQLLNITATTNNNEQTSTYRYDAAGNPTLISVQQGQDGKAQTQRQFTYGARGQLTQIIDANQTTDYRYNHAMQRVSKTIANDEQRYLWQQGLLDAEIKVNDNQETLTRRYIYVGLRPIAMIDYDSDNSPSIYTIHTDHLGTPQQVSNDKQEIVWQGEYEAFGQVTVKATPQNNTQDMQAKRKGWLPSLMNSANATQSITNEPFEFNLRFAGQYEDSESGYYYNWHRYYNPETGRYLTSDPIGLNGGLNTYGYAGQNPVQAIDPWGLLTEVYFMNPIQDGISHSSFGHMAYRINGQEFSFSPTNNLSVFSDYIESQQSKRDMVGLRLKLSAYQESELLKNTLKLMDEVEYKNGIYMCTNPFQDAMQMTGIDLYQSSAAISPSPSITVIKRPTLAPQALFNRMLKMDNLVEYINIYDNINYDFRGVPYVSPDFIQQANNYSGPISKRTVTSW